MKSEDVNSPHDSIRHYLLENIGVAELDDDVDIYESGLVNSLFAIQLMTFLEKSFEIKVTMDDLDMENFKSVNAASRFVLGKREAKRAEGV